ncbi:MAG TPA: hypothetical protein VHL98_22815 [Microvirga sp.]|jgi:hypothetical protein|nr:hypothetical protein [Microvirga sp.]
MTTDVQEGPLEAVPAVHAQPVKKTWREKRWERRRRRIWFEEILGWILVPVIVVATYWLVETMLGALGTSTGQVIAGLQAIVSGKGAP